MNNKTIHRLRLLSTIISFILICSALLSVADTQAMGYELSIYSATPTIFWIAIVFGLLNGMVLIASDLYSKTGKMWIVGLFQIIFCNCSVVSLYALRGYVLYFGRGDVASHVGMANDVIKYGYFGNNFYPITAIYISQVSQLTNISVLIISKYLPSLFFIIYILSIYCLSKSLIPDKRFTLSTLIASMPIFFAWFSTSIYPMLLSVLTIPFFFYFLQRNQDYRFRFFCIIFTIIYPFFHPIIAMFLLLYLVVLFISEKLTLTEKRSVSVSLVLISLVSLVAWFIQQYVLLRSIRRIFLQLLFLFKFPTSLELGFSYLNKLGFATGIQVFLLMMSDEIIYYVLSLFAVYVLFKRNRSNMKIFSKITKCFVVGNLFLLIIFFFTYGHSPRRLMNLNFNMVLTLPLVGYLLYYLFINKKKRQIILVISLVLFSAITAIFSLYPSPLTFLPNQQVTISDVNGMNWLIDKKNPEIGTAYISSRVDRFADLIYGYNFKIERKDLGKGLLFPDHFGFRNDNILPIDEDRYSVITDFDIRAYTEIWKDMDRFRKEDFIKVDYCTNVDRIYENGEFRNYFVHKDVRR